MPIQVQEASRTPNRLDQIELPWNILLLKQQAQSIEKDSEGFPYTNNEQIERQYMKTIPFTIASKKNQIPRSKLNKECEWHLQGELQTPEERDWGWLEKVEWSPMLMVW
jgi:hypothetical protein